MNGKSSWRCRNFPFGLLLRAQERSRRELVRRSLLALTTSLGASNGKCAEAFLMAPTILIECGFEALRHSRLLALLHQGRVYRHRGQPAQTKGPGGAPGPFLNLPNGGGDAGRPYGRERAEDSAAKYGMRGR
jgi:hypothetical protein